KKATSEENERKGLVGLMRAALPDVDPGVIEAVAILRGLSEPQRAEAIELALLYSANQAENGEHLAASLVVDSILQVPPSDRHDARAHKARAEIVSKMAKTALGGTKAQDGEATTLRQIAVLVWELENTYMSRRTPAQYRVESLVEALEELRGQTARDEKPEIDATRVSEILSDSDATLRCKVADLAIAAGISLVAEDGDSAQRSRDDVVNNTRKALKTLPF
ncbi:MAG: hypothetical protein WBG86_16370, partial [Polyangiales bacterium]